MTRAGGPSSLPPLVAVRGGGELASAAARLLFLAGFRVVVLELPAPLAVRRQVSFADAVWEGTSRVEGVEAHRVEAAALVGGGASPGHVVVVVDPEGECLAELSPDVVVDGRMTKRAPARVAPLGAFRVGLGPGFVAGADVEAVVETQRGPRLGAVLWSGAAEPDSAQPAPVLGIGDARVLRAPSSGRFVAHAQIGDLVEAGDTVGDVAGVPIATSIAGRLRGLMRTGVGVAGGEKVGDVDPRGERIDAARVSDKARAVAAGVLEAVCRRSESAVRRGAASVDNADRGPGQ